MKLTWSYILAILGLICAAIAACLYACCFQVSEIISSISTIISIVLSIVSIHTAYITEKKTGKTLEEIKNNNKTLVNMINHSLSADNYDEHNIKSLTEN